MGTLNYKKRSWFHGADCRNDSLARNSFVINACAQAMKEHAPAANVPADYLNVPCRIAPCLGNVADAARWNQRQRFLPALRMLFLEPSK